MSLTDLADLTDLCNNMLTFEDINRFHRWLPKTARLTHETANKVASQARKVLFTQTLGE